MKYEKIISFAKWIVLLLFLVAAFLIGNAYGFFAGAGMMIAGFVTVYKIDEAVPEILETLRKPPKVENEKAPVFKGKSVIVTLDSGEVMKGTLVCELSDMDQFLYLKDATDMGESTEENKDEGGGVKVDTEMTVYDRMAIPYSNVIHIRLEDLGS